MNRILLVDDDEMMLNILEELLSGYTIFKATNGFIALNILKENPDINLLITDINMPEMNGIELINNLIKSNFSIKIIVLTAFGSSLIENMTHKNGFSYLEKPFNANKLLQVVQERLNDGFSGKLMSLQLCDIIQLICITKKSGLLKVSKLEQEGLIYFKNGEAIHAECGGSKAGDEAFYKIFSWSNGSFDMLDYTDPPAQTMDGSYEYYMFEAMRRKDEQERDELQKQKRRTTEELNQIEKDYSLYTNTRKLLFVNKAGEIVKLYKLTANNKDITEKSSLDADKDYSIVAKFYEYKTLKTKVHISSSENAHTLKVGNRLIFKTYSFHFPNYVIDGIEYTPVIFLDSQKYEQHLYTLTKERYGVYKLDIYMPESSENLKIIVGYITLRWNITETKRLKNYGVSLVDFILHLERCGKTMGYSQCIMTFYELLFESYISFKIKRSLQKQKPAELDSLINYIEDLQYNPEAQSKVGDIIEEIQSYKND